MMKLGCYNGSVSDKELERRWNITREAMSRNGIDCLILYGNESSQGGAIKYFTDWAADTTYGLLVLFPKEGGMAIFGHGSFGGTAIPEFAARGVENNIAFPWAPTFSFTDDYMPVGAVKFLKERGYKKIGLYRKSYTPFHICNYIIENLAGITLISVDDIIDNIKAVKSDEEIEILKSVVDIHDKLYAAIPLFLRPGRLERDVAADIKKAALDLGCETLNIMIGTGNPMAKHKAFLLQNDIIKEGDTLDFLIEVSGPGGYFGELSRMWCLGEPSKELERAVADSIKIQARLASMAKPGVRAADLRTALHIFEEENGYKKEARLFGHGQGVDLVERPCYAFEENMTFVENMFISIHPGMETDTLWAFNTDNYLVTRDGAVRLNKTPQGIFRV